jgi:hypothetical protein
MKNIHISPTHNKSRLYYFNGEKSGFYLYPSNQMLISRNSNYSNKNIYITSDEEIRKNDWVFFKYNGATEIVRVTTINNNAFETKQGFGYGLEYCKKIILTTDSSLAPDVQKINDEFLEWFVKNPSCEEVEVENGLFFYRDGEDIGYKIIIPKEEPKKVLTEKDIFNQKDIDAVTDYISKEQQKQALINMMKSDEELRLYDDIEINRIEVICKDCSDSLEDCTCIKSTIDFPRQEIKLEEVFNDEKKENIKIFIDEIKNPSQPNQALKDAFEKYSEYLEDYENKNTYEHGFKDGAKWQKEQYTIEEQHIGHTIDELDKEYIKGFNEGSAWQQERSYSEEEVNNIFYAICKHSFFEDNVETVYLQDVKDEFEQFKKK